MDDSTEKAKRDVAANAPESEAAAREQGSKQHADEKHRRQAGSGNPMRDQGTDKAQQKR